MLTWKVSKIVSNKKTSFHSKFVVVSARKGQLSRQWDKI